MRLFGRSDKEKEMQAALHHDMVTTHIQSRANMQLASQQQINSLGTAYFLQQDESVVDVASRYCPELIPALSRLNATSKIDKQRDRRIMELLYEDLFLHQEMDMGDEGDLEHRSLLKALGIFARFRILDTLGGYRGKLVTEEIERTTHVLEQPKKKGIF